MWSSGDFAKSRKMLFHLLDVFFLYIRTLLTNKPVWLRDSGNIIPTTRETVGKTTPFVEDPSLPFQPQAAVVATEGQPAGGSAVLTVAARDSAQLSVLSSRPETVRACPRLQSSLTNLQLAIPRIHKHPRTRILPTRRIELHRVSHISL